MTDYEDTLEVCYDDMEPFEVYCYNCDALMGISVDKLKHPPFCGRCGGPCPECAVSQKCFDVGMSRMMFELKECPEHGN